MSVSPSYRRGPCTPFFSVHENTQKQIVLSEISRRARNADLSKGCVVSIISFHSVSPIYAVSVPAC